MEPRPSGACVRDKIPCGREFRREVGKKKAHAEAQSHAEKDPSLPAQCARGGGKGKAEDYKCTDEAERFTNCGCRSVLKKRGSREGAIFPGAGKKAGKFKKVGCRSVLKKRVLAEARRKGCCSTLWRRAKITNVQRNSLLQGISEGNLKKEGSRRGTESRRRRPVLTRPDAINVVAEWNFRPGGPFPTLAAHPNSDPHATPNRSPREIIAGWQPVTSDRPWTNCAKIPFLQLSPRTAKQRRKLGGHRLCV
jgi:hypothetical protein